MFEIYREKSLNPSLAMEMASLRCLKVDKNEGHVVVLAKIPLSPFDVDYLKDKICPHCGFSIPYFAKAEVVHRERKTTEELCIDCYHAIRRAFEQKYSKDLVHGLNQKNLLFTCSVCQDKINGPMAYVCPRRSSCNFYAHCLECHKQVPELVQTKSILTKVCGLPRDLSAVTVNYIEPKTPEKINKYAHLHTLELGSPVMSIQEMYEEYMTSMEVLTKERYWNTRLTFSQDEVIDPILTEVRDWFNRYLTPIQKNEFLQNYTVTYKCNLNHFDNNLTIILVRREYLDELTIPVIKSRIINVVNRQINIINEFLDKYYQYECLCLDSIGFTAANERVAQKKLKIVKREILQELSTESKTAKDERDIEWALQLYHIIQHVNFYFGGDFTVNLIMWKGGFIHDIPK